MRRIIATAAAVAALAFVPADAQAQVQFGATAAYNVDAEALGVGAVVKTALPALHENVGLMGDFTYYFPDGFDYWELNGNLTYDFAMEDSAITPFAMGGLVVAHTSLDLDIAGVDTSSTDVGLNVGGGVTFGESNLTPTVGGKFELRDGSAFVIFGSVLFGGGG